MIPTYYYINHVKKLIKFNYIIKINDFGCFLKNRNDLSNI